MPHDRVLSQDEIDKFTRESRLIDEVEKRYLPKQKITELPAPIKQSVVSVPRLSRRPDRDTTYVCACSGKVCDKVSLLTQTGKKYLVHCKECGTYAAI
jgi:hypothetical protein